jgi:hypothetical protein
MLCLALAVAHVLTYAMIYTANLLSVASLLAVASASPSLVARAGTIGTQCNNTRISQGWLIGDCLTGSGTARITSGTYLHNKVGSTLNYLPTNVP